MFDVIVRKPSPEEFLKVAEFSFNGFINELAASSNESPAEVRARIEGPPLTMGENDIWLLVEKNSQQVGFLWVQIDPEKKSAFGFDIHLEPEFRSMGIGRHIMQLCGEQLKELGIDKVEICVFEHNEIARKLYASLGFKVTNYSEKRRQFSLEIGL